MNSKLRSAAIAIFTSCIAIAANATSGKLNSSGCHNSKKAGYHCHRAKASSSASKSKAGNSKAAGAPASPASSASRPRP